MKKLNTILISEKDKFNVKSNHIITNQASLLLLVFMVVLVVQQQLVQV